ncbi:helix-turn-helix domain-containing protein [Pseudorhodoferax sp. Leaf267]|uniref:winged helix-turn-helix transcriptional regulator n=1 Tax=Pseudorhodoferax sp. Leaf267 TaxID=1736316 RepID=UPI001F442837|nr:winged helix-turn-helix transcriptional regulator [Pseudorhodoferax sp. Leaf267]
MHSGTALAQFDTALAQFADARRRPTPCPSPFVGHRGVTPRDKPAVFQLLALLEARYALRVLWALRDGHAQTFRLLQDSVGGVTPNTLNTRLKELRAAELVTHGPDGYVITPLGADLARRLNELPAFAHKWAAGQTKKSVPPPSPLNGDIDARTPAG